MGRCLAGMVQRVRRDVVVLEELRLERGIQFLKGGARVGEVGVAAGALGWEFVSFEDRVRGTARVKRRVDVKEAVALVVLCSGAVWVEDLAGLGINVAGGEELVVVVAWPSAVGHIRFDIVQVAETPRELDVAGVVEAGVPKDHHPILDRQSGLWPQ